jgi:hypothetical protein
MPFDVLPVTGLLPDNQQRRMLAAFTEYCLRAHAPEGTRAARRRRAAQLR